MVDDAVRWPTLATSTRRAITSYRIVGDDKKPVDACATAATKHNAAVVAWCDAGDTWGDKLHGDDADALSAAGDVLTFGATGVSSANSAVAVCDAC